MSPARQKMSTVRHNLAAYHLLRGGVIAHPTETIFGLACLAENPQAAARIINIKNRPPDKGLIILTSDIAFLKSFVHPKWREKLRQKFSEKTVRPTTYLVPANDDFRAHPAGRSDTVAVRRSDHPLVRYLCERCQSALVSTSANPAARPVAESLLRLRLYFRGTLDFVLAPEKNHQPSMIVNLASGERIR